MSELSPLDLEQIEVELPDFTMEVYREAQRMRARAEARTLVEAESRTPVNLPPVRTLTEFLSIPDEPTQYVIEGLLTAGARVILAAQYKSGKTTLLGNLIRSLVDGDPFLETFEVHQTTPVTLIDNELDERMLRSWLRAQGIQNTDAVRLVSLRGSVGSFDLLDGSVRAQWAEALHSPGVVLFDCLRPVLDALGLDENREAGRFLVAFDAFLKESEATEAVVVHHMGHSGERSRGDSRLQDWPESTWKLVRQDADDPSSPRYFSAFGRNVDEAERALSYDDSTRRLTLTEGNRKQGRDAAQTAELLPQIVEYVELHPGVSGSGLETLPGAVSAIRTARRQAVAQGLIVEVERQGRGGGKAYYLPSEPNPV